MGWECSSVEEHVSPLHKALGSIPSTRDRGIPQAHYPVTSAIIRLPPMAGIGQ